MLTDKMYCLVLPDGPPERLVSLCDIRGAGFPLAGLPASVGRYLDTSPGSLRRDIHSMIDAVEDKQLRRDIRELLNAVEDRKIMRDIGRAGGFGRPGRPPRMKYSGKPLSPKRLVKPLEFADALKQMQWTLTGQLLLGDLQIMPAGEEIPAGHYWPGTVERFDDSCGDDSQSRWNAFSVFTNGSSSAFQNIRCLDQGGNGAGWGSTGAYENFNIRIRAGHDAVYWGPRTWAANWWATARHGVRVDRSVTGPGDLWASYQEAQPGQSAAWSEIAPGAEYQTGWYPLRQALAIAKASPFSERGNAAPGVGSASRPSAGGGRGSDLPAPPPRNTRQVKYAPAAAAGIRYHGTAVEKLFHLATEIDDAVDIIYECLPKSVQDAYGCKGDLCKLNAIASNLDKFDWGKAAEGLARNEIEDQIAGRGFGAAENAGGSNGRLPRGIGLGQFR